VQKNAYKSNENNKISRTTNFKKKRKRGRMIFAGSMARSAIELASPMAEHDHTLSWLAEMARDRYPNDPDLVELAVRATYEADETATYAH
jgi:hypothetical protein